MITIVLMFRAMTRTTATIAEMITAQAPFVSEHGKDTAVESCLLFIRFLASASSLDRPVAGLCAPPFISQMETSRFFLLSFPSILEYIAS